VILIDLSGSLEAEDGWIAARTNYGSGEAGTIHLTARSLELIGGGALVAGAYWGSNGNAGTIRVEADSVLISEPAEFGTGIFVPSHEGASGDAGTIYLDVGDLVVAPGGGIGASAFGGSTGNAGRIDIDADTVHVGPHPDFPVEYVRRRIPASLIDVITAGPGEAGSIEIDATESILVTYEDGQGFDREQTLFRLEWGLPLYLSGVLSATLAQGEGGAISLRAPDITVTEGSIFASTSVRGGAGGDIELRGERIRVLKGAIVDATSFLDGALGGDAGDVKLVASESIEVAERRSVRRGGVPFEDWSRVSSASLGAGQAGRVTLEAPQVVIDAGAVATTALPDPLTWGDLGASTRGGAIEIAADEVIVRGGGRIDASTFGDGPGGSIAVTGIGGPASDSIVVEGAGSGIASRTGDGGLGGDVSLAARRIDVRDGGEVEAASEAGLGEVALIFLILNPSDIEDGLTPTGNAGSVTLTANELRLFGGTDDAVTTVATNAELADGGNVTIEANDLVHLADGQITAAVTGGTGGKITIDPEVVILQDGSSIEARAGEGTGGTITITADNYFAFPGTVVDASSDLGLDGVVEVNTPDVNLAGALAELPSNPLDAASQMKEPCAARRIGERAGSFAVRGAEGIPPEPDGWLPATRASGAASGQTSAFEEVQPGTASRFAVGGCR
jgi:hypothetical protein